MDFRNKKDDNYDNFVNNEEEFQLRSQFCFGYNEDLQIGRFLEFLNPDDQVEKIKQPVYESYQQSYNSIGDQVDGLVVNQNRKMVQIYVHETNKNQQFQNLLYESQQLTIKYKTNLIQEEE
ncbi:hypothetical protein ABPG72_008149, partial [Tetrahymena utriculariae]